MLSLTQTIDAPSPILPDAAVLQRAQPKAPCPVKFLDLQAINARYRPAIDTRIAAVLDRGWYLLGQENEQFCKHFAAYCGTRHAVGVANGLDALHLIIKAYGFGVGDEIIGSFPKRVGKVI